MDFTITLFTPTFNRGYIIENLYHSLQRQSDKNFEWLVIDDGSSDDTETLFKAWVQEERSFDIRYFKTENRGKHRAVNCGLDLAKGKYFMVVDSDDYLTNDAVEKLQNWIKKIQNDDSIVGVVANKGYTPTQTVNAFFDEPYLDKGLLEMNTYTQGDKRVLSGERAMCFNTEFHRKYKYPEFENEKFLTEAVVYNRMSKDGYKMRFYNDIIWVFEYRDDGLSHNGNEIYMKNPRGYGLWIQEYQKFIGTNLWKQIKMYYAFTCDLKERYDVQTIAKSIGTNSTVIGIMIAAHVIVGNLKHIVKKRKTRDKQD